MQNSILSKSYVLQNGVNFEKCLTYGGLHGLSIVRYGENGEEIEFTGLAYEVYGNGNIESYMFVSEGIKQGEVVDFYPNGDVKSISNLDNGAAQGKQYSYYENGQLEVEEERIAGFLMTYTKYDEKGTIIDEKKEPTEFDLLMAKKFG
ncbi:hypothetical protein [uncultured Vagococcus sp.]|uniref:toxin-antitoxin system YwqK family antitoxin n=1 Tax=uncultured Vagococcus sp. TaxID=189676 RepID=UPI0028D0DAD2|nr:hypothetical protein [uncultured Vagococcus sp.]